MVSDLTLDEMFALEKEHTPFVGSKTNVFLKPAERAAASARRANSFTRGTRAKALSKSQIAATIAQKSEISKKQATEILDHIAQLAYKHAKDTLTLPGIGKVELRQVPSHQMTLQFGSKKGLVIRVPAKRVVKFRVAKAAKEAILKK